MNKSLILNEIIQVYIFIKLSNTGSTFYHMKSDKKEIQIFIMSVLLEEYCKQKLNSSCASNHSERYLLVEHIRCKPLSI